MSAARHIVTSYDQELQLLRSLMTEMGGMVERQVALAIRAIVSGDAAAATQAVELDPKVDALDRDAEQLVIRMLALRQPLASDLRQIVAAMKITAALERIGDYAKNMARRSIVLGQFRLPFSLAGLTNMSRLAPDGVPPARVPDAAPTAGLFA